MTRGTGCHRTCPWQAPSTGMRAAAAWAPSEGAAHHAGRSQSRGEWAHSRPPTHCCSLCPWTAQGAARPGLGGQRVSSAGGGGRGLGPEAGAPGPSTSGPNPGAFPSPSKPPAPSTSARHPARPGLPPVSVGLPVLLDIPTDELLLQVALRPPLSPSTAPRRTPVAENRWVLHTCLWLNKTHHERVRSDCTFYVTLCT